MVYWLYKNVGHMTFVICVLGRKLPAWLQSWWL